MSLGIMGFIKILKKIDDGMNITELSRYTKMAYCHLFDGIKLLEKNGIITTEKDGRQKIIKLTKKGLELKNKAFKIDKELREMIKFLT